MDPYEFAVGVVDGQMMWANRWGELGRPQPMEEYWQMRRDYVQYLGMQGVENPRVPQSMEPMTDSVPSRPEEVAGLLWEYGRLGR